MNKVCIIAGQSGEEIVNEFKKRNIDILLICGKENESGSELVDKLLVKDLSNTEEIVNEIKKFSKYLFLGTGHKLAIKIAKKCFEEGIIINFDAKKAELFKNKLNTHKYVKNLGYDTPLLHVIENEIDNFTPDSYPVVLKSEEDSFKTEMISDENNFFRVRDLILSSNSKVIVEKFINGFEVTIPVYASKNKIEAKSAALDMTDINKKAVSILKGFDLDRENKFLCNYKLSKILKEKVSSIVRDIILKSGFIGYPRFDIMIEKDKVYILEINAIMVTALGGSHYGWENVGMNPASDMVELFLENNQ